MRSKYPVSPLNRGSHTIDLAPMVRLHSLRRQNICSVPLLPDYTYMYPNQWKNGNCGDRRAYVCESKLRVGPICTPLTYTPSSKELTKCYKIYYESTATFDDAGLRCTADGASQLVVFNTDAYRQEIVDALKRWQIPFYTLRKCSFESYFFLLLSSSGFSCLTGKFYQQSVLDRLSSWQR